MNSFYTKPTFCIKDSEGYIGNLVNFRKQDFIIRLDLLQDWIHDLKLEYDLTQILESNDAKNRRKAKTYRVDK